MKKTITAETKAKIAVKARKKELKATAATAGPHRTAIILKV